MSLNDKLDEIFKLQEELQEEYGIKFPIKDEVKFQNYINDNTLYLFRELGEALNETRFKKWKKNKDYNQEKFKEEIIDCWHFLINLTIAGGIKSNELFDKYLEKNKINSNRIEDEY